MAAGSNAKRGILRVAGAVVALLACGGCAQLRYENTAPFIEKHIRARRDPLWVVMFKASILVPARDILTLDPLWRVLFGDPAWNAGDDQVADSSFFTDRRPEELTPERVARGPCTLPPPQPPYRLRDVRCDRRIRLRVTDALGREFLVKLDDPDYPELGSTAAIVGSRILWALGYRVPPIYLIRLRGTGDPRFDGRRATATLLLEGVRGHFHFDWFRYRRELRALRLACAWINDTDRIGSNTLVVVRDGRALYYLIDFDSCLGSWQGRPKEPWRGHRPAWQLLAPPPPQAPVLSPALGRLAGDFDPLAWQPQAPNNAFNHMTPADAAWIIRRIARLRRGHLEAIVAAAQLSDPQDAELLVEILLRRQAAILSLRDGSADR